MVGDAGTREKGQAGALDFPPIVEAKWEARPEALGELGFPREAGKSGEPARWWKLVFFRAGPGEGKGAGGRRERERAGPAGPFGPPRVPLDLDEEQMGTTMY